MEASVKVLLRKPSRADIGVDHFLPTPPPHTKKMEVGGRGVDATVR